MGWADHARNLLSLSTNVVMPFIIDRVRSPLAMDRSRFSLVAGMQAMESRQSKVRSSQWHSIDPPSVADATTTSVGELGRVTLPPFARPTAWSAFPPRRRPAEERLLDLDGEGRAAFWPIAK